jgi:formate dehydrogenase maturation protein FdhE
MEKMKPCPFCGTKPVSDYSFKYYDDNTSEVFRHVACIACKIGLSELLEDAK